MPQYKTEKRKLKKNIDEDSSRPSAPTLQIDKEAIANNAAFLTQRLSVHYEGFDDVLIPNEFSRVLRENIGVHPSIVSNRPRLASIVSNSEINELNQRHSQHFTHATVLPPTIQTKALLIYHKSDKYLDMLKNACQRNKMGTTAVQTTNAALQRLENPKDHFRLVIIDTRYKKFLNAEHISRSIRLIRGNGFTAILGLVAKSSVEDELTINSLFGAGITRCIPDGKKSSFYYFEIKQTMHSIVLPYTIVSMQQVLYAALNQLKEVVIITNTHLKIQYANRSAERVFSAVYEDLVDTHLSLLFASDISSIINNMLDDNTSEFEGILIIKRSHQKTAPMLVRVNPVACIARDTTHFVVTFELAAGQADLFLNLSLGKETPRPSMRSVVTTDMRPLPDSSRRASFAKPHLEQAIRKVMNLLSQVQESSSSEEAHLIDRVMDVLKSEVLHHTPTKEKRAEDPIASDLIEALINKESNVYASRHLSNEFEDRIKIYDHSKGRSFIGMPSKIKTAPLLNELLDDSLHWEFDVFKLEAVSNSRPLRHLGMEMFRRFDVFATLNVEECVCRNWLALIENNYHSDNTYHNSTHAADVMQATGAFIYQLAAKELVMDRLEEATALIAAATHDIDHPGRSSAFLCNSSNALAILYNDLTVLESHHASFTFKLTLSDDHVNIFKNLNTETYKLVRATIIDMILATEMTRHFEHLAKFVNAFDTNLENNDIVQTEEESSILMRRMLIKVADVNNPTRPLPYCMEWARRIAEEYFTQTEEEKAKNLPLVMPMFDRSTCSIPKSQIGFIDYILHDMMHAWDNFIDMPELITYMEINYNHWKKLEEQGICASNGYNCTHLTYKPKI